MKIDKRISAEKRRKILDEQRYYHARIEMMYEEMIYELSELLGLKESTIQKVLDESP